jgi:transposase
MKAYSQDLRNCVIKVHTVDNMTPSKISRLLNIGVNTVYDWIRRFETTGDYSSKQGVGCGPEFRFTDKESILAYIAKNPDANGIEIRDAVAPNLPMSTFYDTLTRLEITFKKKSRNTKSVGTLSEKSSLKKQKELIHAT